MEVKGRRFQKGGEWKDLLTAVLGKPCVHTPGWRNTQPSEDLRNQTQSAA